MTNVVGEIVNALEETLLERRPESFVELANSPGRGIHLEKLEAKDWRKDVGQGRRHLLVGNRGLQHLQQPRLLVDLATAGLLGAAPKPLDFFATHLRLDEGGRDDRDHRLGPRKLLQQFALVERRKRRFG